MSISQREIDQAYSDLRDTCGGVKEDYFGLLYIEREFDVTRERSVRPFSIALLWCRKDEKPINQQNIDNCGHCPLFVSDKKKKQPARSLESAGRSC